MDSLPSFLVALRLPDSVRDALPDALTNSPYALTGTLAVSALGALLLLRAFVLPASSNAHPLPPGPSIASPLSLPGSQGTKMPTAYAWLTFADWGRRFGDVVYVNVFRNPLLIVNSQEAAFDLLEKKSAIYSSRPVRTMQGEVMGFTWLFSGLPYGPAFKARRTLFHTHFQSKAIPKYHPVLTDAAHTLLRNLASNTHGAPTALLQHLRRTTTAIVLSVCYGHHVAEQGDDYVRLADQAMAGVSISANFGTFLVDYLPILKYTPSWLPGRFAQWKRDGLRWRALGCEMCERPFSMVKARLAAGSAEPCLATTELETLFADSSVSAAQAREVETIIKDVSATAYAGGSDTTLSILLSFFLAMVLHPDVQERAYAEIRSVTAQAGGEPDRLPSFADRPALPYLDAVVSECLRWNPVGNVSLAHYLTEDDVYRGWRVPKGTTVLANIWAMLHEPTRYPNPSTFDPARFADRDPSSTTKNPPPDVAYGFGRRVCPGRYLASDTIWIVAASVFAAFEIRRPLDGEGREVLPEVAYTPGLFSRPKPFGFRLVARSERTRALVAATAPGV